MATKKGYNDYYKLQNKGLHTHNSQASKMHNAFIVIIYDPKAKMNTNDYTTVKKALFKELKKAKFAFKFKSCKSLDGYIEVICADKESEEWLLQQEITIVQNYAGHSRYGSVVCQNISCIKKSVLVSFFILSVKVPQYVELKVEQLVEQNPNFTKSNLVLQTSYSEEAGYDLVLFRIDRDSLNFLEENSWQLYCGLETIKFCKVDSSYKYQLENLPCVNFYNQDF